MGEKGKMDRLARLRAAGASASLWTRPHDTVPIEALSTRELCWIVKQLSCGLKWSRTLQVRNNPARVLAVCRELRRRSISRHALAWLNRLDPPPCACGQPGVVIVGTITYCRAHAGLAQAKKTRYNAATYEPAAARFAVDAKVFERKQRAHWSLHRAGRRVGAMRHT